MAGLKKVSEGEFKTSEYRQNAEHIALIRQAAFNRTPVNDIIDRYVSTCSSMGEAKLEDGRDPVKYSTFGDPARYPGIGTHRGYKRFERRCAYFLGSNESNCYNPDGNKALKSRIRDGWKDDPVSRSEDGSVKKQISEDVGVYMTSGSAGAMRLLSDALIFPPVPRFSGADIPELENLLRTRFERGEVPSEEERRILFALTEDYRRLDVRGNVVMPLWTYSSHLAEVFRAHGQVRTCELTPDGQIDVDSLERSIDHNTKAVLFATVGNPLCTAMEPDRFDKILMAVRLKMDQLKKPIVVIADTIYEHFRRIPGTRIDPIRRAMAIDNGVPVIDISSFSKMMVLAGARVGFIRHFWPKDSYPDYRHDFLRALELLYWPTLCPVANQPQLALGELYAAINRKDPIEEDLAPLAAMLTTLKIMAESRGSGIKSVFFSNAEVMVRMKELGVEDGYFLDSTVATQTRKLANQQLQGYAFDVNQDKMAELMEKARKAGIIEIKMVNGEKCLRLIQSESTPHVDFNDEGQMRLHGISKSSSDWRELAKRCGIETEDVAYERHKKYIRETTFARTDDFVDKILTVPNVRLHPAYFDEKGNIVRERFNAFYVLWAFEGLMRHNADMMQATKIAELCVQNTEPIIATVPGELFLPPHIRSQQDSFVRQVTLNTPEVNSEIRHIAGIISSEAHW